MTFLRFKQPARVLLALAIALISAVAVHASDAYVVKFRLANWKSAHFNSVKQAKSFQDSVTKIGCEVKQHAHDGHVDVTYRCPDWKSIQVGTDDAAHGWESWLKKNGFETSHQH